MRIAILIDLGFFLPMYVRHRHAGGRPLCAAKVAQDLRETACAHVRGSADDLLRILVYDCRPLAKRVHNPISGKCVDFAESDTFRFRTELHRELVRLRKVALRYGELADRNRWIIRNRAMRRLLNGTLRMEHLREADVVYDIVQKGVDTKMSLDIAALAFKRLVGRIVLITGDADFVPAAKLARREGIDVILDPLWGSISSTLHEHIDGLRTHWPRRASTRTTSS